MIDNRLVPYAALFLRLSLSFLFFAHLYRKFAISGFDAWWSGLSKRLFKSLAGLHGGSRGCRGGSTAVGHLHPLCQPSLIGRRLCFLVERL